MDDDKFEAAWSAHALAVRRYCTYSTGSAHDGEDIMVETFTRFLAKGDSVPAEKVEAWLIRVARNLCANHHRRISRGRQAESLIANGATAATEERARPATWEYVRRLREADRLVVYLRIAEDRSFAEIARVTSRSEGAVKMTFYRAIDRLRREIERDAAVAGPMHEGGVEHA